MNDTFVCKSFNSSQEDEIAKWLNDHQERNYEIVNVVAHSCWPATVNSYLFFILKR